MMAFIKYKPNLSYLLAKQGLYITLLYGWWLFGKGRFLEYDYWSSLVHSILFFIAETCISCRLRYIIVVVIETE